jgi:hypothetical protein
VFLMTEPAQEVMSEADFDAWVNDLFRNPRPVPNDLQSAILYDKILDLCKRIRPTRSSVRILPSKKGCS